MADEFEIVMKEKVVVEADFSQARQELAEYARSAEALQRRTASYTSSPVERTAAASSQQENRATASAASLQANYNKLLAQLDAAGEKLTKAQRSLGGTGIISQVSKSADDPAAFKSKALAKLQDEQAAALEKSVVATKAVAAADETTAKASTRKSKAATVSAEAADKAAATSVESNTQIAAEEKRIAANAQRRAKAAEKRALLEEKASTEPVLQPTPPGGFNKPVVAPAGQGKQEGLVFGEAGFALQNPEEGTAKTDKKSRQKKIIEELDKDATAVAATAAADAEAATSAQAAAKTYKYKVTAAQAEEYQARELAGSVALDGPSQPNPYAKIQGAGTYNLTEAEIRDLKHDASVYTSQGGPAEGDLALKNTYKGIENRANKVLAGIDAQATSTETTVVAEKVIQEETVKTAEASKKRTKAVEAAAARAEGTIGAIPAEGSLLAADAGKATPAANILPGSVTHTAAEAERLHAQALRDAQERADEEANYTQAHKLNDASIAPRSLIEDTRKAARIRDTEIARNELKALEDANLLPLPRPPTDKNVFGNSKALGGEFDFYSGISDGLKKSKYVGRGARPDEIQDWLDQGHGQAGGFSPGQNGGDLTAFARHVDDLRERASGRGTVDQGTIYGLLHEQGLGAPFANDVTPIIADSNDENIKAQAKKVANLQAALKKRALTEPSVLDVPQSEAPLGEPPVEESRPYNATSYRNVAKKRVDAQKEFESAVNTANADEQLAISRAAEETASQARTLRDKVRSDAGRVTILNAPENVSDIPRSTKPIVPKGLTRQDKEDARTNAELTQNETLKQIETQQHLNEENSGYAEKIAQLRTLLQQTSAAIEKELVGHTEYAQALANTRISQAQTNAAVNEELAKRKEYAASLAQSKAAQQRVTADTQKDLAVNTDYALATAEAANARRVQAALAKKEELTGVGIGSGLKAGTTQNGFTSTQGLSGTELEATQAKNLVALRAQEAENLQGAELAKARVQIERQRLLEEGKAAGFTAEDVALIQQGNKAQTEYNTAMKRAVAAAQRADYQALKDNPNSTSNDIGTLFQRLQAKIGNRDSGSFKDPTQYAKFGQFLESRFLTTAGFAVSGILTYTVFSQFQKMITDSTALEKILQQVKAEFVALGDEGNYAGFRDGILSISRATGATANEVAALALQFKGAFSNLSDSQILDQTKQAVELSKVTGISLTEITNNLVATAVTYGTTAGHIGDIALTLQDRTGVTAKETITAMSDMAVAAQEAGATVEQVGAISAVASKYTGQAGAAVAEGLNRILPALQSKAGQIIQLFQQARPDLVGQVTDALASGNSIAVFDLIGKSYQSLDRNQRTFVASLLGSRRDAKTAEDVFGHYTEVLDANSAALQSNGRLHQSYAALQNTLAQQLARVSTAFKAIGAELLSLGLSTVIQEIAKSLATLISSVGAVLGVFTSLNDITGGWLAKGAAIAATFYGIAKALKAINEVGYGGFASKLASNVPGGAILRSGSQADRAAATSLTEKTVGAAGLGVPFVVGSGQAVEREGKKLTTVIADWGKNIGTKTGEATGVMGKSSAAFSAAFSGLEGAFAAAGPLLAIAAIVEAINLFSTSYGKKKAQLKTDASTYASDAAKATDGQLIGGSPTLNKDLAQNDKDRKTVGLGDVITHQKIFGVEVPVALNPIKLFEGAGKDLGIFGGKTSSQIQDDAVQQRSTKDFATSLRRSFGKDELKGIIDNYNKTQNDNSDQGKQSFKTLTEEDVKKIASTGTTDDKKFRAVIELFTEAAKNRPILGKTITALYANRRAEQASSDRLSKQLTDLPTLQVEASLGQISPITFNQQATVLRKDLVATLDRAIAGHSPQATITSLKQQLDAVDQAKDQVFGKFLTDQIAAKAQAATISGADQGASLKLDISANVHALSLPGAQGTSAAPGIAQKIVTDEQALQKYQLDRATSQAEVARIMAGVPTPPAALLQLNVQNVLTGLPQHTEDTLGTAANTLGITGSALIAHIITAKGGIEKGIHAYVKELEAKLVALKALHPNWGRTAAAAQKVIDDLNALNPSAIGDLVTPSSTIKPPTPVGPTTQEQNAADAALATAQAGGDPLAAAAAAQKSANNTFINAPAGSAAYKYQAEQKQTAILQANTQYSDAIAAISASNFAILAAEADGDPLKAAQVALAAAQDQAAHAHGIAARNQAIAAEITAQHQIRDAIFAIADSQVALLIAIDNAAGDTVKAAKDSLAHTKAVLARDLARGVDPHGVTANNDRAAIVTAQASVRDASLQHSEDDINFLLNTHQIFAGQAIARLKVLDATQAKTTAQHHQIEEQIYSLKHQLESDLQFNLPTDLALPTLYEARRFNEGGAGGSSYTDNRRIQVIITANTKASPREIADHVTTAISAPSRNGNRAKTY